MRYSAVLFAIAVLSCFGGLGGRAQARTALPVAANAHMAPRRVVVPAGPTKQPFGSEQGIVIEGEPPGEGGGGEAFPQVGDLMFRSANVYLVQGTDPMSQSVLPLYTPGNVRSWTFVAGVQEVGHDLLPPKSDGTYRFQPFGDDEMKFN